LEAARGRQVLFPLARLWADFEQTLAELGEPGDQSFAFLAGQGGSVNLDFHLLGRCPARRCRKDQAFRRERGFKQLCAAAANAALKLTALLGPRK